MDVTLFKDEVFRFLCQLTVVENFYRRAAHEGVHIEGSENHSLIGCLIVRDVPGLMKYVNQDIVFTPIKGLDFRKKVTAEAHLDGAYAIEYGRVSNKVFMHNFVSQVMRYKNIKRIEVLQERYLPSDFLTLVK